MFASPFGHAALVFCVEYLDELDQSLEQPLTVLQARSAAIQVVQQLIDGSAELRQRRGLVLDPDAGRRRQVRIAEGFQLLGECGNRSLLTALPEQQRPQAHRCQA